MSEQAEKAATKRDAPEDEAPSQGQPGAPPPTKKKQARLSLQSNTCFSSTSSSAPGERVFGIAGLADRILDYADVKSLVMLTGTNRMLHQLLKPAVQRRKKVFAKIKAQIQHLVVQQEENLVVPSSTQMEEAFHLQGQAKRLIDSGLDWLHHRFDTFNFYDFDQDGGADEAENPGLACPHCARDTFFHEERLWLKPHVIEDLARGGRLLPKIFYVSEIEEHEGLPQLEPTEELVNRAFGAVLRVWHVEDHMQGVHKCLYWEDQNNPDEPLEQFDHTLAQFFKEMTSECVSRLISQGLLEAFRVAAREHVWAYPNSLSCLMYAVTIGDELSKSMAEEDWSEED